MTTRLPNQGADGSLVTSPCNSVCRIDAPSGHCEGCGRSLQEIAAWSTMGDDDKRRVWAVLPQRRAALVTRTGLATRADASPSEPTP
jgi:predicted Fe-S protein YdhL (DUF1289 family)